MLTHIGSRQLSISLAAFVLCAVGQAGETSWVSLAVQIASIAAYHFGSGMPIPIWIVSVCKPEPPF